MVCNGDQGLTTLGILLDPEKNVFVGQAACEIQASDSRVSILVIPTDEEKEIARQTAALIGLSNKF
jgi:acetate kinase